jgi:hypothetical protein
MGRGDYHAFPISVEAFQSSGRVSAIIGRDGYSREILRISGGYGRKNGYFEWS